MMTPFLTASYIILGLIALPWELHGALWLRQLYWFIFPLHAFVRLVLLVAIRVLTTLYKWFKATIHWLTSKPKRRY